MKFFLLLFAFLIKFSSAFSMHFATSADTEHFEWALNLIASIHRYNFEALEEIAVFDLGLLPEEKRELESLQKVKVYSVEAVNPDIFTKFKVNSEGKIARGWYSWKPVIIKQALDLFPEFIYFDAGVTLTGSSELLFEHLRQNGCLFIDCGHTIQRMATVPVIDKFKLKEDILNQMGISAGIQGITQPYKESYALPLYQLAKEIVYFADDGSAPKGFGWARHDQALFSIQARLLKMPVSEGLKSGKIKLLLNGKEKSYRLRKFFKLSRGELELEQLQRYLKYVKIDKNN